MRIEDFSLSEAPVISATQTGGDDPTAPHVEEIPLGTRLALHLHGPHEPAHAPRPSLVTVNLRYEIFLQEVLVIHRVVIEVSVVNPAQHDDDSEVDILTVSVTYWHVSLELPGW